MIPQHTVQFYEDEAFLTETVASFVKVGLQVNDTLITLATSSHRSALRKVLTPSELANTNLLFFDAVSLLADIMVEDCPDHARFMEVLGNRILQASQKGRVRVFGEMVAVLWAEGKYQAAIRLKELWSTLQAVQPFSLFQALPLRSTENPQSLLAVCHAHTHVRHQKPNAPSRTRGVVAALISLPSFLYVSVLTCCYILLE